MAFLDKAQGRHYHCEFPASPEGGRNERKAFCRGDFEWRVGARSGFDFGWKRTTIPFSTSRRQKSSTRPRERELSFTDRFRCQHGLSAIPCSAARISTRSRESNLR